MTLSRRSLLLELAALGSLALFQSTSIRADPARDQNPNQTVTTSASALKLIEAAREQIGVTLRYNGAYHSLSYPDGDVERESGVCTDVVIRAYRDAFGVDLQKAVHEDMQSHFGQYPKNWGLSRPDSNIDHRRVPNLQTYFKRQGALVAQKATLQNVRPGDLVTQMVSGNLPHIVIVSDRKSADGIPLVIHNIGAGTQEENRLMEFPHTGHYRFLVE